MNKMIRVTQEEFYKVIYQFNLDAIVTAFPNETLFELRHSRELIGRTEGYKSRTGEEFYELSEKWITKARGER